MDAPDAIFHNGRITTLDPAKPQATAVAVKNGRFTAVGDDAEIVPLKGPGTKVVDLNRRVAIPGLNDSHIHLIRGGLNYNLELRWDGVPSLADALRMLKEQVARTPAPQWVRVVGGWTEWQFAERRLPTLAEVNAVSPDTPVFLLHLYDRAILNAAAVRAVGYTKDTPNPPGGEIQRDNQGNPTGLLIAKPNALILYATLAKGPKLGLDDQINSSRQFMRELNRLGVTSVIDAGGGFQNYPDDYQVIQTLADRGELTVRIAANLFTQRPGHELEDFQKWTAMTHAGAGDDFYRINGAGEMLVFSAADFEDFLEPRPDLPGAMEAQLKAVVTHLAQNRWPFRLHATYEESITRVLNVFEEVNKEVPIHNLRWLIDHAETISDRSIDRVKALGGGIAVQHRMAYQGEYFVNRYGATQAEHTPPIRKMLAAGIPVGAGTDATRVASYNPWVALHWLTAGKTVGGLSLYPAANKLDRVEALRRYTVGSAWFSGEDDKKGAVKPGMLADLAVLSGDYFAVPDDEVKRLESVLTVVGGKVVYGATEFAPLGPPPLPFSPDWAPPAKFGGYHRADCPASGATAGGVPAGMPPHRHLGFGGCDCFVF
jgi:hypothetical protein